MNAHNDAYGQLRDHLVCLVGYAYDDEWWEDVGPGNAAEIAVDQVLAHLELHDDAQQACLDKWIVEPLDNLRESDGR